MYADIEVPVAQQAAGLARKRLGRGRGKVGGWRPCTANVPRPAGWVGCPTPGDLTDAERLSVDELGARCNAAG